VFKQEAVILQEKSRRELSWSKKHLTQKMSLEKQAKQRAGLIFGAFHCKAQRTGVKVEL